MDAAVLSSWDWRGVQSGSRGAALPLKGWERTAAACLPEQLVTTSPPASEKTRIQGVRKSFLPRMCVPACSSPAAFTVAWVQWKARPSAAPRQARGNLHHCGQPEIQLKTCVGWIHSCQPTPSELPPRLVALPPSVQASSLLLACPGVTASLSSWQPWEQQGRAMPQQYGIAEQPEIRCLLLGSTSWIRLPSLHASPNARAPYICGTLETRGSLDSGWHGGCSCAGMPARATPHLGPPSLVSRRVERGGLGTTVGGQKRPK